MLCVMLYVTMWCCVVYVCGFCYGHAVYIVCINVYSARALCLTRYYNQACTDQTSRPGFLKLLLFGKSVWVCVCVCVLPLYRLLITSGMMWHDMDPVCI